MYKYQCSSLECGSMWTLHEGCLNGFVLTCPICGKGRGLFISQTKREIDIKKNSKEEEMTIEIRKDTGKSVEIINERIEELRKKHYFSITEKSIDTSGNEIICRIRYENKRTGV
ncbi:MAG: hypothetical protein N3I35_17805 [Clostridia bacterium]|nr:hypothetical protein [Clostridia bacterium]